QFPCSLRSFGKFLISPPQDERHLGDFFICTRDIGAFRIIPLISGPAPPTASGTRTLFMMRIITDFRILLRTSWLPGNYLLT
ncbi:hypothetical protein LDENG_00045570, partial [Lucifuga dentata]